MPNKSLCSFCSPTLRILFACLVSVIQYLVHSVESVQRRFTKYLPGFSSVSYSERLKRLKFDTLELRRLYIDLILCFKICNGYVALDKNDFFAFNPLSCTRVIALRSPFLIPVSTHVNTSLQSELFLLGITYQQLSLLHRQSVFI